MSARVLFTTQPGLGHLVPLLPVADGLRDRGHAVVFATSASFADDIVRAGHSSRPAGHDWLTSTMATTFPEIVTRPPGPERYAWARKVVFASETARASLPDIAEIARDWDADLIVREAAEYGGCLAAELLDIPHAVVRTDSGSSSHADRHDVANPLDAIRADIGLSPDPDAAMAFRYLLLSFAPRCLDGPDHEAAPTTHHLRPAEPDDATDAVDIAPLAARPDQPTVYATLGTIYNQPDLLAAIVQALATEPVNLIMTVGPDLDPVVVDPQLPNVRVERWIPQQLVLPHCAAVVTHGGYGTVTAALTHGCPLVLLPISADQPHNAAGCAAAGVGINVAPSERSPETIRAATTEVLRNPAYRLAAQHTRREMLERPPLEHGLDLLETLARERIPITS